MSISIIILYILSVATIVGTLLPWSKSKHWFIRGQANFRAIYLFLNAAIFIVLLNLPLGFPGVVLAILHPFCFLVCLRSLIRFTPFTEKTLKKANNTDRPFKLLIHNVYQYNTKYDLLIDLVKKEDPDLVLLLETGPKWSTHLQPLYDLYPNKVEEIKSDTYGIIMLSKFKMRDGFIRHLKSEDIPSAEMLLQVYHRSIRVLGIHPKPPIPGEARTSLPKEKEITQSAHHLNDFPDDELQILIGDLNDVAWSKTTEKFIRLTGMKDPRKGRGFFSTFPTYSPIKMPLDHVFSSPEFKLIKFKSLPNIGSDHLPILVNFQVP